jgi:hypothetical protein
MNCLFQFPEFLKLETLSLVLSIWFLCTGDCYPLLYALVCVSCFNTIDIKHQTFLFYQHDAPLFQPCAVYIRNIKSFLTWNYSLQWQPHHIFFRTAIGSQNNVDADHWLKMPGSAENIL